MTQPKVSIIIPTYNRANLLPRAIVSVLEQDFRDFEVLVVDDGSQERIEAVVSEYQNSDPRLRYLRLQENHGIGYARNFGLQQAHGEYTGWLDKAPEKVVK